MQTFYQGKVLGIIDQAQNLWSASNTLYNPLAILDVILVALILYWGYLLLKETRAMRILYGIAVLVGIFLLGKILQLTALNYILKYTMTLIAVAIPVVFQPELRGMLEKLGRARIIGDFTSLKRSEIITIISEIIESVEVLSKNKVGALIVLMQKTGLREYIETGVKIDAKVSRDLILSIFTPNTPLHDGAIIISGSKIVAGSCTLPLSDYGFDFSLGTRHKAALGLSQESDAIIIVVSEQTGSISLAYNGHLIRELTSEKLEEMILDILHQKQIKKSK